MGDLIRILLVNDNRTDDDVAIDERRIIIGGKCSTVHIFSHITTHVSEEQNTRFLSPIIFSDSTPENFIDKYSTNIIGQGTVNIETIKVDEDMLLCIENQIMGTDIHLQVFPYANYNIDMTLYYSILDRISIVYDSINENETETETENENENENETENETENSS